MPSTYLTTARRRDRDLYARGHEQPHSSLVDLAAPSEGTLWTVEHDRVPGIAARGVEVQLQFRIGDRNFYWAARHARAPER
jgi:hypothetical protein